MSSSDALAGPQNSMHAALVRLVWLRNPLTTSKRLRTSGRSWNCGLAGQCRYDAGSESGAVNIRFRVRRQGVLGAWGVATCTDTDLFGRLGRLSHPSKGGHLPVVLDRRQDRTDLGVLQSPLRRPASKRILTRQRRRWELITPSDDEPFDISHPAFNTDYESSKNWEAHVDTDDWMPAEIAHRYGVPDCGWSLNDDYEFAEYLYPTEQRDEIEQALRDLGFHIVHNDALINAYWYGAEDAGPERSIHDPINSSDQPRRGAEAMAPGRRTPRMSRSAPGRKQPMGQRSTEPSAEPSLSALLDRRRLVPEQTVVQALQRLLRKRRTHRRLPRSEHSRTGPRARTRTGRTRTQRRPV
jgi:hypothetical protein